MSQKSPLAGFKWVEEICQFSENFIRSCNKDIDEGYFLDVYVHYVH